MGKLFGTDGIRGKSNIAPMDAETALKVGMASGAFFTKGQHKHRVIIGKDTRLSGYMIEQALTAGFLAMGMDVFLVGPMPTPAIALITRSMRADVGVMISASHNPYHDNGIKLFQPNGLKLSDETESKIEDLILNQNLNALCVEPEKLGKAKRIEDAIGRYIEYIKQTFPKRSTLSGLKIVLDCANGAAYKIAPIVLWELGAEVIAINCEPNGFNINDNCGSTYPEVISEKVKEHKADIGIALDGDADRLIVCDENGNIIDGDQIMATIAVNLKKQDKLKGGAVVSTIMSNLGLENYLKENDINLIRTKVGDRYVMEAMRNNNCNFGGEQSGHIIFNDYTTTGDGIIAALQILSAMVDSNNKASKVLNTFTPCPQVKDNIKFSKESSNPLENDTVQEEIRSVEQELGQDGRIVLRKSGTEPLIRIMVEGENKDKINSALEKLKKIITENL